MENTNDALLEAILAKLQQTIAAQKSHRRFNLFRRLSGPHVTITYRININKHNCIGSSFRCCDKKWCENCLVQHLKFDHTEDFARVYFRFMVMPIITQPETKRETTPCPTKQKQKGAPRQKRQPTNSTRLDLENMDKQQMAALRTELIHLITKDNDK